MLQGRPVLDRIRDYVPGKSPSEIREAHGLSAITKLASNENPLGPSPLALKAAVQALSEAHIYPRGDAPDLRGALARTLGVKPDMLVIGNGSDEILQLAATAFLESGDRALTCTPTFSVYNSVTMLAGASLDTVPLRDYAFDVDGLLSALTPRTRILFVCNPNNPTGTYLGSAELKRLLSAVPEQTLVVVDQAYREFSEASDYPDLLDQIPVYPNLLVTRTFSKVYGLAGLRVGYGIASASLIRSLAKVKPPFNTGLVSQAAAAAALADTDHFARTLRVTRDGKAWLATELARLGLEFLPTQANFIAVHVGANGPALVSWLESQGMIVRGLSSFGMPEWIRVSIGTAEQNRQLISLLEESSLV